MCHSKLKHYKVSEVTGLNECSFAVFSSNSSLAPLRRQDFVSCKIK